MLRFFAIRAQGSDAITACTISAADSRVDAAAADEGYDPYLTMRRNMQHADDDFAAIMWLRKVLMLVCCCQ